MLFWKSSCTKIIRKIPEKTFVTMPSFSREIVLPPGSLLKLKYSQVFFRELFKALGKAVQ